jgi:hypothetical protein
VETRPALRPADPFASTIKVRAVTHRSTSRCLGVVVAPRVALTAAHCVRVDANLFVQAATTANEKSVRVESYWVDPKVRPRNGNVDIERSDIAILVLAQPLAMPAYAPYAHGPIDRPSDATGVRNGGREGLLEAMGVTLRPATNRYYATQAFAAPGDSGSPLFVEQGVIVGVLAGGSTGREIFARVDLVAKKLDELVARTTPATPPAKKPAPPPKKAPSPASGVTWT